MIKLYFGSNSPFITYLFLFCFWQVEKLFQMGTSKERLRDLAAGLPQRQMIGRSREVCKTSVKQVL